MKKGIKRTILLLLIIIAILFGIKRFGLLPYKAELLYGKKTEYEIAKMEILDKGILATWDGDRLMFIGTNGKTISTVDRTAEGQEVFFGDADAMLYDKDVDKLVVFGPDGKEKASYALDGELFRAEMQNGVRLLHIRYDDGERLFVAEDSGSLSPIFETKNFILDFAVQSRDRFAVSELSDTANGYKTTVFVSEEGDARKMEKTEFPMEVSMRLVPYDFPVVVTEKHLYGIQDELITKSVPILSDVCVYRGNIYTLYSGILGKRDKRLEETKQYLMGANVNRLAPMPQGLFAYGNREILGNVHAEKPYKLRFAENPDTLSLRDGFIAAYGEKSISVYALKPDFSFRHKAVQDLEEAKTIE